MAQHEIETQWMGKMQFNSLVNGHTIVMDAPERVGGEDNGPIPKPFVLSALSGCTGMDIVAILRKSQKEVRGLDIKVTGELSKQQPIETQWMGKMQFNSLVNGHTIVMDAPERVGGEDNGPIPKPFVLTALSGCTGMDIVAILRKSQKEVKGLDIKVTGELSKQQPIEYVSIHVTYDFAGDESCKEAALDAVTVSQEKYCGVSHMLRKALPVTWEVNYNGTQLFSNKITDTVIAGN